MEGEREAKAKASERQGAALSREQLENDAAATGTGGKQSEQSK